MDDKGEKIVIESSSQLKFVGTEIEANLVRATRPIDKDSSSFYFELKVVNSGEEGAIAIGLTQANVNTRSGYFPGWKNLGIGYHGDDGGIFHESSKAIERGEPYATGDVVGCYLCRTQMNDEEITLVQFTRNGKKILSPRILPNADWYPTIGLASPGAIVETNFDTNQSIIDTKGLYYGYKSLITKIIL